MPPDVSHKQATQLLDTRISVRSRTQKAQDPFLCNRVAAPPATVFWKKIRGASDAGPRLWPTTSFSRDSLSSAVVERRLHPYGLRHRGLDLAKWALPEGQNEHFVIDI